MCVESTYVQDVVATAYRFPLLLPSKVESDRTMLWTTRLGLLLLSLISTSHAQTLEACPSDVQNYNASGLLGFFDPLISGPRSKDDFDATIDNDGYLYHTDDDSPAPPASFAYALTVSDTIVNGARPAILSALLATAPSNRTLNATETPNNATRPAAVACGLSILHLPLRTTRLGQDDDGTCTSTFPRGCAKKIVKKISEAGMLWPRDSTDVPGICRAYAQALSVALNENSPTNADLPGECTGLFLDEDDNFVSSVEGISLTGGKNQKALNPHIPYRCDDLPIVESTLGVGYAVSYPIWNNTQVYDERAGDSFNEEYDDAVRQVLPIVTLILSAPPEDVGSSRDVEVFSAHLGCLRTTGFTQGSRRSPELKPLDSSSGLSSGAIAGVVVGVSVIVAAVGGWAIWRYRRWKGYGRRAKHSDAMEMMGKRR